MARNNDAQKKDQSRDVCLYLYEAAHPALTGKRMLSEGGDRTRIPS